MDTLILKSKVGSHEFSRRTFVQKERGTSYEYRKYEFNSDNDFKTAVPKQVWEELCDKFIDHERGIKYKHAFFPL